MFSSQGQNAIKPGLKNILRFCKILNDPQTKFKSVHVAGTNGKGSTSHMLAAILQTAGYKTGLYTSPHLRDFRERIRINGEMISEAEVTGFVADNRQNIEQIEPSFFETTVALAFQHFVRHKVEVAVIEVGLGGRLDSTNIIHPLLSVITNIGLDHVNILGDTLSQIASEKAGIIKPGVPVVIGEKQPEVEPVFSRTAADNGSKIIYASDEWEVIAASGRKMIPDSPSKQSVSIRPKGLSVAGRTPERAVDHVELDLTGLYQLKNLATVLTSVDQLRLKGFRITEEHVKTALKQVTAITGLMGRWQTLSTSPLVICDTGHNEDGIREVLKNIKATPYSRLHMVIGMVKDKDISKILRLLPENAVYYFCQPDIPRAKDADSLTEEARAAGLIGNAYTSVRQALNAAEKEAGPEDLIFVGGSTFVVAEVV